MWYFILGFFSAFFLQSLVVMIFWKTNRWSQEYRNFLINNKNLTKKYKEEKKKEEERKVKNKKIVKKLKAIKEKNEKRDIKN
tara:strand:+ start:2223 stop:2468 length:246 start_codon:yes stop_codon:yes gene_type:complete